MPLILYGKSENVYFFTFQYLLYNLARQKVQKVFALFLAQYQLSDKLLKFDSVPFFPIIEVQISRR